jgi:hypothetical protein
MLRARRNSRVLPRRREDEQPSLEAVVDQIAVLAGIDSPAGIFGLKKHLRQTIEHFSVVISGAQRGPSSKTTATAADRKLAREIYDHSRALENRLKSATPYLRQLLTPPWFPGGPTPRTVEEIAAAVVDLRRMSSHVSGILSLVGRQHWRSKVRDAFYCVFFDTVELCGGQQGAWWHVNRGSGPAAATHAERAGRRDIARNRLARVSGQKSPKITQMPSVSAIPVGGPNLRN